MSGQRVSDSTIQVLLAEDDAFQRKIVERWLSKAGYPFCSVESGEEALARCLQGDIQILITDWDMPGALDGASLCRRIREAALPSYVYILMLTGRPSLADTVTGLEAGADDYVRKPAEESEILARLKTGCRILRLERQNQRLSVTDALCGCYNRRYLNEQLPRELARAKRYANPLALIMADIDYFKTINDTYGHLVGDEVLQAFVSRSESTIRPEIDWIARYGGEEFVLVLPETDAKGARVLAERLRLSCAQVPFNTSAGEISRTVSFGVASVGQSLELKTPDAELLAHADAALYCSKRGGRNRVS
jgi:two-component system, cell cycle response regulator